MLTQRWSDQQKKKLSKIRVIQVGGWRQKESKRWLCNTKFIEKYKHSFMYSDNCYIIVWEQIEKYSNMYVHIHTFICVKKSEIFRFFFFGNNLRARRCFNTTITTRKHSPTNEYIPLFKFISFVLQFLWKKKFLGKISFFFFK